MSTRAMDPTTPKKSSILAPRRRVNSPNHLPLSSSRWDLSLPRTTISTTQPRPDDLIEISVGTSTAASDKENRDTTTPPPRTFHVRREVVCRSAYFADVSIDILPAGPCSNQSGPVDADLGGPLHNQQCLTFEPRLALRLPDDEPAIVHLYLGHLQSQSQPQPPPQPHDPLPPRLAFRVLAKAYVYGARIRDAAFAARALAATIRKAEAGDAHTHTPVLPGAEAAWTVWAGPVRGRRVFVELWWRYGLPKLCAGESWPRGFQDELRRRVREGGVREGRVTVQAIEERLRAGTGGAVLGEEEAQEVLETVEEGGMRDAEAGEVVGIEEGEEIEMGAGREARVVEWVERLDHRRPQQSEESETFQISGEEDGNADMAEAEL